MTELLTLTSIPVDALVDLESVAAGTVWFVNPVNPYRVQLGIIRHDGREWVGDLNPEGIEVALVEDVYHLIHLDYEDQ
jgi:hypothetical protein